jgi:hypothetical protein
MHVDDDVFVPRFSFNETEFDLSLELPSRPTTRPNSKAREVLFFDQSVRLASTRL